MRSSRLLFGTFVAATGLCLALPAAASPATFSNSASITITDNPVSCLGGPPPPQPATVYPSQIAVSGITDTVTDVNVTLNGFSHTFPDDVDVLLVGPADNRRSSWETVVITRPSAA